MRERFLALAVALSSFAVVTGTIVGVGLATAEPASAQMGEAAGRTLTAAWKGVYLPDGSGTPNTFDANVRQDGARITGSMVEPNAFGDQTQALFLTSTIKGSVTGNRVSFVKTYDGAGGVSHSVNYEGQVDASGRRIRGTFSVQGGSGVFEMAR